MLQQLCFLLEILHTQKFHKIPSFLLCVLRNFSVVSCSCVPFSCVLNIFFCKVMVLKLTAPLHSPARKQYIESCTKNTYRINTYPSTCLSHLTTQPYVYLAKKCKTCLIFTFSSSLIITHRNLVPEQNCRI